MTSYQVYIFDDQNTYELDTENIDIKSIIALADITDISARKSPINSIQFKGTKRNNEAFGSVFDLSRTSNFDISNSLGFNYNPLRPVSCFVYENSTLIFKGSLRVAAISIDEFNQKVYDTVLTSTFIDIKTTIQDKLLSDLDFSDMKHHYSSDVITNSWSSNTERYDASTNTFYATSFDYGKGYVYPMIDYGYTYSGATGDNGLPDVNQFNARNFKSAVYVREYFNRIFSDDNGLSGYTYEILASDEFNEMFDHLIVPDSQEVYKQLHTGFITTYSKPLIQVYNVGFQNDGSDFYPTQRLVPLHNIVLPSTDLLPAPFLELYNATYNNILSVRRGFSSKARVMMSINASNPTFNTMGSITFHVSVVKRPAVDNQDAFEGWQPTGENSFTLAIGESFNGQFQVDAGLNQYDEGDQIAVMISASFSLSPATIVQQGWMDVFSVSLIIPPTTEDFIEIIAQPSLTNADLVTPVPPANIKQVDFLKGIINQFNFFVYTNTTNNKHLIFELYDDFNAYMLPQYIKDNSLDWSAKIDYKKGLTMKTNIDLPKSYLFTYKPDEDYLNTQYKNSFNETYGQFAFDDRYGLVDTKKVELMFSPTIIATELGTDRKYPLLYKLEGTTKRQMKTNPKLLYYNGMQTCQDYSVYNVEVEGGVSTDIEYSSGDSYPQVSNYYLKYNYITSVYEVINDLYFNRPKQLYFPASPEYLDAPNSYQNYYINKVSDLTNKDVIFFEANALLTEVDMANLDLHVPVYIQTGHHNGAYFRIQKVERDDGSDSPSSVVLQKIGF